MENSYDAENAVLSILICNPELAFEVTSLKTEMFSSIAISNFMGIFRVWFLMVLFQIE